MLTIENDELKFENEKLKMIASEFDDLKQA
jgi:hypothetical protein